MNRDCSEGMNWVVVLNLWSYKSCLYNQVSLHWNLHVKQPLIGKLVINQIRCHCLTMTRFMGKQRQLSLPFSILLNYYLTIYPCQWMELWFIYNPVLNSKEIEEKFQTQHNDLKSNKNCNGKQSLKISKWNIFSIEFFGAYANLY